MSRNSGFFSTVDEQVLGRARRELPAIELPLRSAGAMLLVAVVQRLVSTIRDRRTRRGEGIGNTESEERRKAGERRDGE